MLMKKGVSPLIASVLLIAMTMSVALLASSFFPNLISDTADDTSESQSDVLKSAKGSLEITESEYNNLEDNVTVSVLNGPEDLDGDFTATVFCENNNAFQEQFKNMSSRELKTVEISVADCNPVEIEVDSNNYSISTSTGNIPASDSFSWVQAGASEFRKIMQETNNVFFGSIELAQDNTTESETSGFSGTKMNITEDSGVLKLDS